MCFKRNAILAIAVSCIISGCQVTTSPDQTTKKENIDESVTEHPVPTSETHVAASSAEKEEVPTEPETAVQREPSYMTETESEEESTVEFWTEPEIVDTIPQGGFHPAPGPDDMPALEKLIADYLSADGVAIDYNPVIWTDIDALVETNPELANVFVDILSLWDKASADGFQEELPDDDTLCFVVLGYKLNPDGSMDDELVSRLQVAREYALKYPQARIIVTGGNPVNGLSEARAMYDWLVSNGIAQERIQIEEKSRTTIDNVYYSYRIMCAWAVRHVAVITSGYHLQAATQLFQEHCVIQGDGIKVSAAIPSPSAKQIEGFSAATRASWIISLTKK